MYFSLLLFSFHGSLIPSSGDPKGIPGPTSTTIPPLTSCFSITLGGRYKPAGEVLSPLSG